MTLPLSLEGLQEYDSGSLEILVRRALQNICRDCADRPTLKTRRKMVLTIEFLPIADGPHLKHVEFAADIATKIPKYGTSPARAKATKNGFAILDDAELEKEDAE